MKQVMRVLDRIEQGDPTAADELLPLVYEELRRLAAAKMAQEPPGQTLQATSLVHEAWLRLGAGENRRWANRAHFFAAAAEAMRRILIDRARRKHAARHGGGLARLELQNLDIAAPRPEEDLLQVDEALAKFAAADPHKAELVKLRYFAGMTLEEAAEILGISASTAKRWWTYARAWLYREINSSLEP
jgi:RNA polymerase sigma factor (TIGR02999 family)